MSVIAAFPKRSLQLPSNGKGSESRLSTWLGFTMARMAQGAVQGLPLRAAVVLLIAAYSGFPQSAALNDQCDLGLLGATETKSFLAFDREFRTALSRQDAAMMTLLVSYPLRVNVAGGSWYLNDPGSLQSRFQEIFPPAVRAAVLKERPETIGCTSEGIMYGTGTVWVNPHADESHAKANTKDERYLVETINLPSPANSAKPASGRVEFVCETGQHRIIVDLGAAGAPRYREWDKPRSLTEKPSVEIPGGSMEWEGTGPCSHSRWAFTSATTQYAIEELGRCYSDSDPPPKGAKGSLDVTANGKPHANWRCF